MAAINQCLWCKNDIAENREIWIERQSNDDGHEWHGVFCGDEHASLWVAKPFEPPIVFAEEDWRDTAFIFGCLSVLAFAFGAFVIGVIVAASWIIDRIG
jgi:hypothetical protein